MSEVSRERLASTFDGDTDAMMMAQLFVVWLW